LDNLTNQSDTAPVPEIAPAARNLLAQDNRRRQMVVLLGAFALLVAVVGAAGYLVYENRRAGDNVLRSQQIVASLWQLLSLVQDAETGQRGYLLAGDPIYLAPYYNATEKIDPVLQTIEMLTFDNPRQLAAMPRLRSIVKGRLDELAQTIALIDRGDRTGALAMVASDAGKVAMDEIRGLIARMTADATQRLNNRLASWTTNGDWLFGVLLGAVMLVIMVTALTTISARAYIAALETVQAQLRNLNERLEQRVRERTAEIQEANDEIQKFAYVVSHDLRSPLVNIMGFTNELDMIRAEYAASHEPGADRPAVARRDIAQIDADFAESLDFIKQATSKMDRLINAVLKLARSGQRQFHYEQLDMTAMVQGIATALTHQAVAGNAEIVVEPLPALVGDRLSVDQIFANLLDNAVKYLDPARRGRIVVRGRAAQNFVRFDVEDNGRGVDPADLQRIFELFRRAGPQDQPGEGIGLAHIRALIRRLGGRISCQSELGRGTTFSVWLPQGDARQ
jgi:signal transduction histidine kinase